MDSQYTYLLLDLATLFFPLVLSFDRRVAFYRKWGRLFPAIAIGGTIFVIWDHFFTLANYTFQAAGQTWTGIWNFNPEYLTGIYLFSLPIEEILFFLVVPYACVFIYEVLKAYIPSDPLRQAAPYLNFLFMAGGLVVGLVFIENWYTSVTFIVLAGLTGLQILIKANYMGWFYLMWAVHLVPFYIINGFLTGLPVVIYNNSENLGVRVGTVPIEDGFYSFGLLLLIITIYENFHRVTKYLKAPAIGQH